MVKKIVVLIIALAFVFSAIAAAFANGGEDKKTQASQLAALLPESDGIMTVDVTRMMNEALPQILSANQPKLDKIMGEIDKFKAKTGFDLRRFEKIAVGVKSKRISDSKIDFEPVLLARGVYDANGLIAIAKVASKGEYRTENFGDRKIYIFSMKEFIEDKKPATSKNSTTGRATYKIMKYADREVALASFDRNTLVFGTIPRVKETLGARSQVNTELMNLVYRNQNAAVSFGMNMPERSSALFKIGNDEIDTNIDAIRQLYGTMDVVGDKTVVSMTARTASVEDAENLEMLISGLREIGGILLGGTKGADKQVYIRMIENTEISKVENEVLINLEVSQSDIDVLIGEKK